MNIILRGFFRRLCLVLAGAGLALAAGAVLAAGPSVEVKPWTAAATPALEFDNLDGTPFDASVLRGKKVVVNFWAVWCAPCREEIPALERLAQSVRAQGVEVLLVNAGDSRAAIDKFLAKMPVKLRVLRTRGDSANAGAWQVSALPTTAVLDSSGQARWILRGAIDASGEPLRRKLLEGPVAK